MRMQKIFHSGISGFRRAGGGGRNSRGTTTKKLLMWPKKEIRFVLGCVCDESFAPERNTDSQCFVKTCHALNQRVQSS